QRRSRMADEAEEVALAAQLLCMPDTLAHVGPREHEARHALAVRDPRQRPRDVDRPTVDRPEAVLVLRAAAGEHCGANALDVLRDREDVPERPAASRVLAVVAVRLRERLVEADDPSLEIDDAEERGRGVHDLAHEVALALKLV